MYKETIKPSWWEFDESFKMGKKLFSIVEFTTVKFRKLPAIFRLNNLLKNHAYERNYIAVDSLPRSIQ